MAVRRRRGCAELNRVGFSIPHGKMGKREKEKEKKEKRKKGKKREKRLPVKAVCQRYRRVGKFSTRVTCISLCFTFSSVFPLLHEISTSSTQIFTYWVRIRHIAMTRWSLSPLSSIQSSSLYSPPACTPLLPCYASALHGYDIPSCAFYSHP